MSLQMEYKWSPRINHECSSLEQSSETCPHGTMVDLVKTTQEIMLLTERFGKSDTKIDHEGDGDGKTINEGQWETIQTCTNCKAKQLMRECKKEGNTDENAKDRVLSSFITWGIFKAKEK